MINFCIFLNLFSIFIQSFKSAGKYYTLESYENIECNDSMFCHFYGRSVSDVRITANAPTVKFECYECNSPTIYAQNAENVIMKYNNSYYGQFHFENAINIDIVTDDCRDVIIYGQNADNVIVWSNNIYLTIFYFNYVSTQINFVYFGGGYATTIIAEYATSLNISFPQLSSIEETAIYCPYQNNNVCNFMFTGDYYDYGTGFDIYIANMELGVVPLYFNMGVYKFNIFCNENENGIYESFTEVEYKFNRNTGLNRAECRNITSECCIFTDYRTDIICQDDDNNVCVIDCASNDTHCEDGNINPTNTTNELYVLCDEYRDCFHTIINCPTTLNSLCYVSCENCYNTVIKYNTNNKDITLNCTERWSCEDLSMFVDKIDNNTTSMIGANISCHNYGCYHSNFFINTEMSYFNIDCIEEDSCKYLLIHAETTKIVTINCIGNESCYHNDIYDEIEGLCSNIKIGDSCNEQDGLQYLTSMDVSKKCTCSKHEFFCCPFSNVYKRIYHCDDDDDCYINLDDNEGTLIYANNANLLSLTCTKCSYVNIFAMNASNVEIKCKQDCHDINLNGVYINQFYFECDINEDEYNFDYDGSWYNGKPNGCENLVFDVSYSKNIFIKANFMMGSQIYASNAGNLSLICNNDCAYLGLWIPSETYIECDEGGCKNIFFYSYNGWESIKNVNIFTCDGFTFNESNKWYLYSPFSINLKTEWKHRIFDDKCNWNARLQQTFCQHDYLNVYHLIHDNVTNIPMNIPINFIFDPFSIKCRPVINESMFEFYQIIFDIILCIISLCIIIFWFIYSIKQMYLKYFNVIKYYQITQIYPPSQKLLLYIHCSDILIWITQIYLIIIICALYEYYEYNICQNAIQNYDNNEAICLSYSVCSFQDENCTSKSIIYDLFITMSVMLGFSLVMDILRVCMAPPASTFNESPPQTIIVPHSILIRCKYRYNWDIIIEKYYWKRQFFRTSVECHECDHWFWDILIMITRYFIFFICALILYFLFNDINFHLKWYDIFPILCVLIINEFIKIGYKYLTPYDKSKHIQYYINQIVPETIGLIIWEFMNDDKMVNDNTEFLTPQNCSVDDYTEIVELMEPEHTS